MNGAELLSRFPGWMPLLLLLLLVSDGPKWVRSLPCTDCTTIDGIEIEESQKTKSVGSATQKLTEQHPATKGYWIEPMQGLKVGLTSNELSIRFSPFSRSNGKPMMVQMPMKMAEIKWMLLRSILVGKVAIVLILIRTLMMMKGQQDTKIVVLRAPQKEMHEHFYHHMEDPEDSKPGWLGKGPEWFLK
ncbi:hypothetical protein QAD02_015164 [Eretmocerus hayati]|uniref:Uncharacterized protein n=1 Tax=Eretmocerus hayati TaxID=131215 RepID=A0ACC2PA96_9HYME|nr:hypothetical protein QAD02_015164 [Eretmocerus hayati]